MAELNHLIVPARDKQASAAFLAAILGVEAGPAWGHFMPVRTANGVTLDFVDSKDVRTQHYAFLVGPRVRGRSRTPEAGRHKDLRPSRQERTRRDQPLLRRP